jgi:nitrite reductase/ring-hydroxylating ferredoxin subunit
MENLSSYFSDDDYIELTLHIQNLLDQLERLPQVQIREMVFDLLGSIDMMHREALVRLLILSQQHAPQLEKVLEQDVVIRSVLALYELIRIEETEPTRPAGQVAFIPLDQIGVSPAIKMPVWIPGGFVDDLPPGKMRSQKFEDVDVLLVKVEGEIFALRDACLDSILPLSTGQIEGHTLICPWHGCRYDVRNGEIQNGSRRKLETFPVTVAENGRFSVGFNISPYEYGRSNAP